MTEEEKKVIFLRLFEPVRERLSKFAMAQTNNREDAKDLVGETILRAYSNIEKLKNEKAFLCYLFSIASNIHKRNMWRRRIFGIFDSDKAEQIRDNNFNPESKTEVEYLYMALKKLPENQSQAIILFEISGFSLEEISEIQKVSISGVKSRLKRGREKLAEVLGVKESKNNNIIETEKKYKNGKANLVSKEVMLEVNKEFIIN